MAEKLMYAYCSMCKDHLPVEGCMHINKGIVKTSQQAVVIIETRLHTNLEFTILNAVCRAQGNFTMHIFVSKETSAFVHYIAEAYALPIHMHAVPAIGCIDDYNRFLTSQQFWQTFVEEYVLIVQTDTLWIHSYDVQLLHKYAYLGAPWTQDKERHIYDFKLRFNHDLKMHIKAQYGNGGFSWRSVAACKKVCSDTPWDSQRMQNGVGLPEDIYFCHNLQHLGLMNASTDVAMAFSSEEVFSADAHALHAPFKYQDLSQIGAHLQRHWLITKMMMMKASQS